MIRLQLRSFLGHDIVWIKSRDEFDQITLRAFTRRHRRTGIAVLQQEFPRVEAEPAIVLAAPVALDAGRLQDGLDFLPEIDRPCDRRGKPGHLTGSQPALGLRETEQAGCHDGDGNYGVHTRFLIYDRCGRIFKPLFRKRLKQVRSDEPR